MLRDKILRYSFFLYTLVLISGCTTLSTNNENTKKELIGTNIDDLYNKWGAPSTSTPLPSAKGAIYVWNRGGCKNNVTADNGGTITNFTASGNCSYLQWD